MLNAINKITARRNHINDFNPYVAILNGETIVDAIVRHRQQTEHQGMIVIMRVPSIHREAA